MTASSPPPPRKSIDPRDEPGSFTIPTTRGGKIQRMVGLTEYMEIYTEQETFRLQTPESIDPARTNPNAMFVQTKIAEVGASTPHVARTILMAHEMLSGGPILTGDALSAMMVQVHRIKETLSQCQQAVDSYQIAFADEIQKLETSGGKVVGQGRMLAYFPVLPEHDAKVTAFLIPARRLITEICQIPGGFWNLDRQHSDPAYLLERSLMPLLGENHRVVRWLADQLPSAKEIIDLRNAQEHPATTKGKKLVIKNFQMLPSNQIARPSWGLEGTDLKDIASNLSEIMEFLVRFSEEMLVACIDANLPEFPPMAMYFVEQPDPMCPIRYAVRIDGAKLANFVNESGR